MNTTATPQEKKVFFVFGDALPEEAFKRIYLPRIWMALEHGGEIIVGDSPDQVDYLAQKYLAEFHPAVKVFHAGREPRLNMANFVTVGGFRSDAHRDQVVIAITDGDISVDAPFTTDKALRERHKKAKREGKKPPVLNKDQVYSIEPEDVRQHDKVMEDLQAKLRARVAEIEEDAKRNIRGVVDLSKLQQMRDHRRIQENDLAGLLLWLSAARVNREATTQIMFRFMQMAEITTNEGFQEFVQFILKTSTLRNDELVIDQLNQFAAHFFVVS